MLRAVFLASSLQLEVKCYFAREMTSGQKTEAKGSSHHAVTHARAHVISIATWNVRTLVESAGGDRRICRSRWVPGADPHVLGNLRRPHYVERKLDLLVKEMRTLGVAVTGIQETKWFGNDVWFADGYTLLYSGRPLPVDSEPQTRNEGAGILLDSCATVAWRDAGKAGKLSVLGW